MNQTYPHISSGGPLGMQTEACKHITNLGLDDTFYIIDLGNVQRMYKVNPRITAQTGGLVFSFHTQLHHLIFIGILARG